jgi:NCS2 family nucleobase:cation symporter-2
MAAGNLDTRKTFIIGTSLLLALSHQVFRAYFVGLPPWLHLLTGSMLSIATLTAIVLNLIFRLGIRRTAKLSVAGTASSWEVADQWLRRQGQDWGVTPEDLLQASESIKEALTLIQEGQLAEGPVDIEISYDEIDLVLELGYRGSLVQVPTPKQLPVDFGEKMPFARGLLAAWHCVPPNPLTQKTREAHCHIRLVF